MMLTESLTALLGDRLRRQLVTSSLALCAALSVGATAAHATTLTVPSQYTRIQDAIDAANSGDTINVLPGTYSGNGFCNLNLGSKNLTIQGTGGAAVTILNNAGGTEANQVQTVSIEGGQNNTTVIRGFTIENSFHDIGGAITIEDSSAYIVRCVFVNNAASAEGGAIAVVSNNAPSSVIISQCAFYGNTAGDMTADSGFGGAVECIVNNTGISQQVALYNCIFDKNASSYDGGAIDAAGYDATSPAVSVVNCTFVKNNAFGYVAPDSVGLIPAPATGAQPGVLSAYNGKLQVVNSALYGDASPTEISTLNGGFKASHCDINQAGYSGVSGDISIFPSFLDAGESDPTQDNLHEQTSSPLLGLGVATGTSLSPGVVQNVDFANQPRHSTPDIGAYEFQSPTATALSLTIPSSKPWAITLKGADNNTPARPVTFAYTNPAHGVLTGTAPNLTYTSSATYSGPDSFTYTTNNGVYSSTPVTVSINVIPMLKTVVANATVPAGFTLSVKATIAGTAPAGGLTIPVSSNSEALDGGYITIAAGASTGTVALATHSVITDTPVTLTVAYGGVSFALKTTVQPAIQSVVFGAASGYGGVNTAIAVSLYAPAGPDGVVVTLSSSDTTMIPAGTTLTIPAGAYSAWRPITPTPVSAVTVITGTATLGSATRTANFTVNPAALISLTSSTPVAGGLYFTVSAALQTPAPAGGATVAVTSNSAAVAGGSIVIPAGAKTGSVSLRSSPVSADTNVTLTGTYAGTSKTTTTLVKPSLQSVLFASPTVAGGTQTSIGVLLSGPAGPGGITVSLSSADTRLVPPGTTITVPAGYYSYFIHATPSVVASDTKVTVTATLGTATASGVVTVTAH